MNSQKHEIIPTIELISRHSYAVLTEVRLRLKDPQGRGVVAPLLKGRNSSHVYVSSTNHEVISSTRVILRCSCAVLLGNMRLKDLQTPGAANHRKGTNIRLAFLPLIAALTKTRILIST